MNYLSYAKEGLTNLAHAKLRSLLALFGILVGTASVVAMVLGGELATNAALKEFKSLGTDLLAISMNGGGENQIATGKLTSLTLSQAFDLTRVDNTILDIAPYTQIFSPMSYQGEVLNGIILGVTDSFANIINIKLNQGRFVSVIDRYEPYCVIGNNVYNQIKHISFKEPLGQHIQIGKQIFVIIGAAESWQENSFVNANIDDAILVPLMASTTMNEYATINNIIIKLSGNADIPNVEKKISKAISNIIPEKSVSFRSAKELIHKMEKQSDILTVFLGLIGSISLIVGGIGVMNIMLVSVIERKREIGIRLAVGAKHYEIALLFLLEAIMLSLAGGVLGVLLGISVAFIISLIWHWDFTFYLLPPLVGFFVSVIVGIFFGSYPAYLAAKLDPIEALRV